MNLFKVRNFINESERSEIVNYASNCLKKKAIDDVHLKLINDMTLGGTLLYDFGNTEITQQVIKYQGYGTVVDEIPQIYSDIAERISKKLNLSKEHLFFQYILLGRGGKVQKHYDASVPGYITYKCNICVDGPREDVIHIENNLLTLNPGDLYCFDANLYKHWMAEGNTRRVHLSFGFILPYKDLGWESDDPRIRLSERIWKIFISKR